MLDIKRILQISTLVLVLMPSANAEDAGGILKADLIFGPDKNLDPAYKYTGWYLREAGIYETLFAYDSDMNLVPELATGYERVSDTEWRIQLRQGVRFHDGSMMGADDVIYSIQRVLDPSNSRHNEYGFIESVEKAGDDAVLIRTKEPYAPTIASLTDPLVSVVRPGVDLNTTPVGTGPFRFESYENGVRLEVKRFDDYWGGAAKLEGAVINYVSDPMTRALQLEGGDVEISRGFPQTEVSSIEGRSDLDLLQRETLRSYFLYVNMKRAPFDDPKVRKALNYAIDRQEIVDTALEGIGGVPAVGVFPSVLPWSANDDLSAYAHDPEKALALLSEAGIKDVDKDGWLDFKGAPLNITIKTYTKRAENKPSAEVVASQLQEIGIRSQVQILESGALSDDMTAGNYDLALYAWSTAPTGDPDYFLSKHFESTGAEAKKTGYSSPDVDAWIRDGRSTFDQKERTGYYSKVQERVLEDSPEIFLFYLNELVGVSKSVKGFEIYPSEVTFLTNRVSLEA